MDTILQDLRYAVRTLARQPGFTAVAVFTLAVGIGANTAIYSVVDATLLRTLPYDDPARIMHVSMTVPVTPGRSAPYGGDDMVWSYPKYDLFRRIQEVYQETAVYKPNTFNLTGSGEPERVYGEIVGADYFRALGVRPILGRTFLPEEDAAPDKDFVAVISHSLWESRYGADPRIAGKSIALDLRNYTVVGVLPAGFQGLSGPSDVWVPVHALAAANGLDEAWSHQWYQVARLKPGVSAAQAISAADVAGRRIDEAFANPWRVSAGRWGVKARLLDETRIDPVIRKSVLVLMGAVSFVLLIACVNIANLLLARGSARSREIAIRLAVGAARGRLVRQLMTESVLLAMLGAAASLLVASLGVRALGSINPMAGNTFGRRISGLTFLGLSSIHLDAKALLFTLAVALLTGILFGLAPAWQGSRADVTDALKSAGARPSGFGGLLTGKSILVVAEVALAVVLLAGAGLMIKSFGRLIGTRSGIDPDNVLTVRVILPQATQDANTISFFDQLEQRASGLAGVVSAGLSTCHAFSGGCSGTILYLRDRPPVQPGTEPGIGVHRVSSGYFKAMKIPLLRGRWFTDADRMGAPKVVVVSESAARRFWPGEDPIGKEIGLGQNGFSEHVEVVGIAGDVRYGEMAAPAKPEAYLSYLQGPRSSMILSLRTAGNPAALSRAVEGEVHALDKDLPVFDVKTMNERIRDATAQARFSALLLTIFAAIALALAAVGIYGVMSYLVTQRTHEIGIRIALGARSADVLSLVVRRSAALALAGIATGVAGALASTRVLTTLLYEVKPGDPATYLTIAAVLAVVALLASVIPARRASAVDPSSALRS